jgi:hypothetical protein
MVLDPPMPPQWKICNTHLHALDVSNAEMQQEALVLESSDAHLRQGTGTAISHADRAYKQYITEAFQVLMRQLQPENDDFNWSSER